MMEGTAAALEGGSPSKSGKSDAIKRDLKDLRSVLRSVRKAAISFG